jgi:hypothetical protein
VPLRAYRQPPQRLVFEKTAKARDLAGGGNGPMAAGGVGPFGGDADRVRLSARMDRRHRQEQIVADGGHGTSYRCADEYPTAGRESAHPKNSRGTCGMGTCTTIGQTLNKVRVGLSGPTPIDRSQAKNRPRSTRTNLPVTSADPPEHFGKRT